MEEIIKISETKVQIKTPQPDKIEVRSKDDIIAERDGLIATKLAEDLAHIERQALLSTEIQKLETLLETPEVVTLKTEVEVQEAKVVESLKVEKALPPVQEIVI